jgi:AraC-like DNA-binding protein
VNRLLRAITANRWAPELVYFSTRRPGDIRFLKRFFGCPIVFDSDCNALVFHASDLDTPLPTADEQLSAILHRLGPFAGDDSARGLVDEVAKLVEKNLLSGIRSIDSVVRFLPYSRSTLQKKLAERGTSYQRILDGVRDRRARQYLMSSDLSIAEVSEMLAYESQEAFARAFKARLGEPPSAWRRSNRRRS